MALTAVLVQLYRHVGFGYDIINFFSYFTNLSNILFAVFLLAGAIIGLATQKQSPLFQFVRGATVLCMVVVGVVFSLLLRNEDLGTLLPWVNIVLHYVMPVVAVIDWVLLPPTVKLSFKHILAWLTVPLAYLGYTLIRGAVTDWYPYPFLNPAKTDGYLGVSLYCLAICLIFIGAGWLVTKLVARPDTRR